jgi:hypothetical protein
MYFLSHSSVLYLFHWFLIIEAKPQSTLRAHSEHTQSFASFIFTVAGGRIVTGRKGTPRCKNTWSHLSFPQKLADSPCKLVAIIHGAPNAPCFITAFVVSTTRFLFSALTVPSMICVRVCSGKMVERASTRPEVVEVSMPSLQ